MVHQRLIAALAALVLAACDGRVEPIAAIEPSKEVPAAVVEAQVAVVEVVAPAVVEIREVVDAIVPVPADQRCFVHPEAVDLIVRYEVSGRAYYNARLQGVYVPSDSSGATWGVGFDGGMQTAAFILAQWRDHPAVGRLVLTAGKIGAAARTLLPGLVDVRTSYEMASAVFVTATLPVYCEITKRTFRNGWELLGPLTQGALVATVYNRGQSTFGQRRAEMAYIKDVCVPAGNAECVAQQLLLMPRLWVGKPEERGLRARYVDTAKLATKKLD